MSTLSRQQVNSNESVHPDTHALASFFVEAFPTLDHDGRLLAREIYLQLAKGKPVTIKLLADTLQRSTEEVRDQLNDWPGIFYNEQGQLIGFWGIAVSEMAHQFTTDGNTAYTWCAWDSLFIPGVINKTAQVVSHCATTGDTINLTVTPQGVESATADEVMVSFLVPDEEKLATDVTTSFCHYVHFFGSSDAGLQWLKSHPDCFLLSLDEAFAIGKELVATMYADIDQS